MNKINKILFIILSVGLFSFMGCEEEVLDKKPQTTFSEKDVWDDIDLIERYVINNYNALRGNWGYQLHGGAYHLDAATNDIYSWSSYSFHNILDGTIGPDNINPRGPEANGWSGSYEKIRNLNVFLEKIDESEDLDEEKVEVLKGEVKFLRAITYFHLVNFYGGVPIINKVFELDEDFMTERDSYQDVVDFIVSEADEAKEMLPETRSSDNWGRINKGACRALKSEILLYAASKLHNPDTEPSGPLFDYDKENKWQEAADAAKAVIDMPQYSLVQIDTWKDYQQMFLEKNSELILAKPNSAEYGSNTSTLQIRSGPNGSGGYGHNTPTQNLVDAFEMANGKMIDEEGSGYNPSPDSIYENRELRFYANIIYEGCQFRGREIEYHLPGGMDSKDGPLAAGRSRTGYNLRKYQDESIDQTKEVSDRPNPIYRLASFYLNYAEAQYHLGNESIAREYVNKIRNRVHLPDINSSGKELLNDIRHERRIELLAERGKRFFDIRRWMIASEIEKSDRRAIDWKKVDEDGELDINGELKYEIFTVKETVWDDKMYYLPIRRSEMEKAPYLQQNPGY